MNVCNKVETKAVKREIQMWENQQRENMIHDRELWDQIGRIERRRVKYGKKGRLIERRHKHEQMVETAEGKSGKRRWGEREQ